MEEECPTECRPTNDPSVRLVNDYRYGPKSAFMAYPAHHSHLIETVIISEKKTWEHRSSGRRVEYVENKVLASNINIFEIEHCTWL